jgi:hypothetical protein
VNLLCKDFQAQLPIEGIVLPGDYVATQNFVVEAEGGRLSVQSVAPRDTFRIKVTLTEPSWARVWRVLKTQDTDERCGMFLEPNDVMDKLKQIGLKGFRIRLPRSLLRTIEWPVGVSRSVTIRDRVVALRATPLQMELTPAFLWYTASVATTRGTDTSRVESRAQAAVVDSSAVR